MEEKLCAKCAGGMLIAVGFLVLIWNWYLLDMRTFFAKDWPTFIGVLLVIKGILMLAKPVCSCKEKPVAKKKK
ncbi:hypothetical protein KY347_01885 [Candidatus Woesearchaeota archaeon]|nr:hypothetical protein [Candidatus Woesearchaeota archaeon]